MQWADSPRGLAISQQLQTLAPARDGVVQGVKGELNRMVGGGETGGGAGMRAGDVRRMVERCEREEGALR